MPVTKLAALGCAVLATLFIGLACTDDIPSAQTVQEQQQRQTLEDAAAQLASALEAQENRSVADTRIDTDALLVVTLLTELSIELNLAETLLDLLTDRQPRVWPLTEETAAAIGITHRRLQSYRIQLRVQRDRLSLPPHGDTERELVNGLSELSELLDDPLAALSEIRIATLRKDVAAPGFPDLQQIRLMLQRLLFAAEELVIRHSTPAPTKSKETSSPRED